MVTEEKNLTFPITITLFVSEVNVFNMSIKAGMTNNKGRSFDGNSDNIVNTIQTKDDISQLSDYSMKLERILLALVRQQEDLKQQFDSERKYREEKEKVL